MHYFYYVISVLLTSNLDAFYQQMMLDTTA